MPKPVAFSAGVWKNTLVVSAMNVQRPVRASVKYTAYTCGLGTGPSAFSFGSSGALVDDAVVVDPEIGVEVDVDEGNKPGKRRCRDGVSWSARNSTANVRRNRCPDMSCPRYSLGLSLNDSRTAFPPTLAVPARALCNSGMEAKSDGCEEGVSVTRRSQYSFDTTTYVPPSAVSCAASTSVFGNRTRHCAPLNTFSRSNRLGPKNHAANTNQTPVVTVHLLNLLPGPHSRIGAVKKRKRNANVVHPHARFTNIVLKRLDFCAK